MIGGVLALTIAPAGAAAQSIVDPFALRLLRLLRLRQGRFTPAQVSADTQRIALYFGASWCGPCRAFVPALVAAYPRLQRQQTEIIFVSDDSECRAQRDYVLRSRMPWLVIDCADPARRQLRTLGGAALPGLIIVDCAGATLINSWRGGRSYPADALAQLLRLG